MTLKITGSINATINAAAIQHHPNVLGWPHRYECNNVVSVNGIQQGVAYDRRGTFRVQGAGRNDQGAELRIRWSGNTCNVYLR